jgi:hypothetical protein
MCDPQTQFNSFFTLPKSHYMFRPLWATQKQCECAVRAESVYQSVENLREGTTKNTKHQKTLTAAQIGRSMRH